MSEFQNPEQTLPVEIQQPPVFTDAEAMAVMQAQAVIADTRADAQGNVVFREYVMGATYDGTVVSVDERSGLTDDHFVVRIGSSLQIIKGIPLSEQKMAYGTENTMRYSDGGTTVLNTNFGRINISASHKGELPIFEGRVLFPIGEDGKPFSPEAKHEAEVATAEAKPEIIPPIPSVPQPEQVSVGGIRRFLRSRR